MLGYVLFPLCIKDLKFFYGEEFFLPARFLRNVWAGTV